MFKLEEATLDKTKILKELHQNHEGEKFTFDHIDLMKILNKMWRSQRLGSNWIREC